MAEPILLGRQGQIKKPLFLIERLAALDWAALLAFLGPFVLYILTLAPTVYNLDSAELTIAAATDGIVRGTGYPLYLVLGKLWSLLPIGDVGYRLNLFSAFSGALAIFFGEHILRRLGIGGWARLGALGLLAVAPYFWAMSLIAEVYTLHTALVAAIILSLMRWGEQPTAPRLFWPVFIFALSMGNHASTILLAPACLWYVLSRDLHSPKRPATWLAILLGGLLGGSVFLTLPLRYAAQPAFNYAGSYDATGTFHPVNLQTWEGFWWLISGKQFSGQMFAYPLAEVSTEMIGFSLQLWEAFFAIGLGPGILGVAVLLRRDRRLGVALLLFFAAHTLFFINYRVVDKSTMFLPSYLVWSIWLAIGYQTLLDWIGDEVRGKGTMWALRLAMVVAIVGAIAWNWGRVDQSDDWSTRQQSQQILDVAKPNAIIFGWWETVPGVQYLQLVEGQRPDVLAINRFLIDSRDMRALIRREAGKRPIYIDNPPLELVTTMKVTPAGPLFRLERSED